MNKNDRMRVLKEEEKKKKKGKGKKKNINASCNNKIKIQKIGKKNKMIKMNEGVVKWDHKEEENKIKKFFE
jgi:hypothetical protein